MQIRSALVEQLRAALAMLVDCIERCPHDLWASPDPPLVDEERVIHRGFWRIAFHAVYFTHLYLGQNEASFQAPPASFGVRRDDFSGMWSAPWDIEPMEVQADATPISKVELLEYIRFVDALVEPTVNTLDLDTDESGFRWYRKIGKLSHELLSLRHLQGHVGQLSELLFARGIDSSWISRPT